jgi:hypothetical protein
MVHLSRWLLYLVTDTLPCLCDLFRWFMILVLGSNHMTSKWLSLKGHDYVTLMESPWPQILLIKVIYVMFVGHEWNMIKAEYLSGPLEWQLGSMTSWLLPTCAIQAYNNDLYWSEGLCWVQATSLAEFSFISITTCLVGFSITRWMYKCSMAVPSNHSDWLKWFSCSKQAREYYFGLGESASCSSS